MAAPRALALSDIPPLAGRAGSSGARADHAGATQGGRERTVAEYGALRGAAGVARTEVRRMQTLLECHSVVGWKA
jgi:hypothetical protein